MTVNFRRLHPDAVLPTRATPGAAGLDLHACLRGDGNVIHPGERQLIGTGWTVEIPPGFEGQIRPNWRAMIDGLTVLNAPETIDSDYRDELRVLLVNHGWRWTVIGGCIAQLVIAPIAMLDAVEVGQP